ncbi:MAG: methyltransferase [Anaerolineae bacterium]|nr:methyltransferase [Anaerolineae bacterium]
MPVKPNIVERAAFYTFDAAPSTILDLAGLFAYQAVSTANELGLFQPLAKQPYSPQELADQLHLQERGLVTLLEALAAIGYVDVANGRYKNSKMAQKWLIEDAHFDAEALFCFWNAASRDLSPHMVEVIRSGERPFDFYEWVEADPALSDWYQRMLMMNAKMGGADVVKHLSVPTGNTRLLDVGGGHGTYTTLMCQKYPLLHGTILDSYAGLETGRQTVAQNNLQERITLQKGDMFESAWGEGFDLILLFNVLHQFDLDTGVSLLEKAYSALKPGGKVAVLDQVAGKVSGSATNALIRLVAMQYYLFADGRVFSRDDLTHMAGKVGFGTIQFHNLRNLPGNSLITAVRQ